MTDPSSFDAHQPVYLESLWDREVPRITPSLVELTGGGHLLFAGMTHSLCAPSGSGKSWVALAALLAVARETARPVLLLDYEASIEVAITRLRQLGATRADAARVAYWRLDDPIAGDHARQLRAWTDQHRPVLAVLDGVTRATALFGVDADTDNAGYTRWTSTVQQACGANGGDADPGLLLIDHISEKTGSGLNARGVTAKRDTVTGRALVLRGGPVSPSRQTQLTLVTAKCRHGGERDAPAAHVVTQPGPDGRLSVTFHAPDATRTAAVDDHLADVCRRVTSVLGDGASRSVRALCRVLGGDEKVVRKAIALLEDGGHIEQDPASSIGGHHPYRLAGPDDAAAA